VNYCPTTPRDVLAELRALRTFVRFGAATTWAYARIHELRCVLACIRANREEMRHG